MKFQALRYMRAGVPLRKPPSVHALPFLAFWQLWLPLGQHVADARLADLRVRVCARRADYIEYDI